MIIKSNYQSTAFVTYVVVTLAFVCLAGSIIRPSPKVRRSALSMHTTVQYTSDSRKVAVNLMLIGWNACNDVEEGTCKTSDAVQLFSHNKLIMKQTDHLRATGVLSTAVDGLFSLTVFLSVGIVTYNWWCLGWQVFSTTHLRCVIISVNKLPIGAFYKTHS